eukprot:TRINITY_DN64754_c0_g1_i3.p1 TRINITY_DN64754_c0_g1~~TRINITY_DN64754_c0_g1_i3.p1  ORF type:complete len:408 (-),score=219.19 TRINITY_DN64754_c0_g1_i3:1162-2385(-)
MEGVDDQWMEGVDVASIVNEIELHFERLLSRENLSIRVREVASDGTVVREERCKPFDYHDVAGTTFHRQFQVDDHQVRVHLKVADHEYEGQRARFFALGRRINEVSHVHSFMKRSAYRHSLWAHPQLIGYIDVGDCVDPVITRDEFKQTKARGELYKQLLALEPSLQAALEREMEKHKVMTLGGLEDVLSSVLGTLARDDRRTVREAMRAQHPELFGVTGVDRVNVDGEVDGEQDVAFDGNAEGEDGAATDDAEAPLAASTSSASASSTSSSSPAAENKKPRRPRRTMNIGIRFAQIPASDSGQAKRSQLIGNVIEINTEHPDFVKRLGRRMGKPRITDRLSAYLAGVIAAQYKESFYRQHNRNPERGEIYSDLLNDTYRLEASIRRRLPSLQRHLNKMNVVSKRNT